MKQQRETLFVLAVVLTGGLLAGGPTAGQTIIGTSHDLSGNLPVSQRVCVFCHTPHQPQSFGGSPVTVDPLWNHQLSSNASYGVYDSDTFDAGPGNLNTIEDIGGMNTVSNLCMSCHDGTVGLGAQYNEANISPGVEERPFNAAVVLTGNANMGTDLTNDHPINFRYDTALVAADGELNDPTLPPISDWLFGGTVQCATCHDPHNDTNFPFLVADNSGSALCLTCHIK